MTAEQAWFILQHGTDGICTMQQGTVTSVVKGPVEAGDRSVSYPDVDSFQFTSSDFGVQGLTKFRFHNQSLT